METPIVTLVSQSSPRLLRLNYVCTRARSLFFLLLLLALLITAPLLLSSIYITTTLHARLRHPERTRAHVHTIAHITIYDSPPLINAEKTVHVRGVDARSLQRTVLANKELGFD